MIAQFTMERPPAASGVILTVAGEIDYSNVRELEDALDKSEVAGGMIRLDLRRVSFIDSMGLGAILMATVRADERRTRLEIVVSPFIERLIKAAGLEGRLTTEPADAAS